MSQEATAEKTEGTPKKQTRQRQGCIRPMFFILFGFLFGFFLAHSTPWNTMPINGTVIILDENGKTLPFQPTRLTRFSLYAKSFFRSDMRRKSDIYVDESGKFNSRIPGFAATVFLRTKDEKYAAIIDITPDKPPTNLRIELHPRYTVTGRLVHEATGTPLAQQEIKLKCHRCSDMGVKIPIISREYGMVETFHSETTTTDSEGFFTVDNMIPGTEYKLYLSRSAISYNVISLNMPILQPEQYGEPFSLGDVVIP